MDKPWYYEDHGRAKGPISTSELIAKIQRGELSQVDLVYQEGDGRWQPIESFKELTSQVKAASVNVGSTPREAEWIILRVVEVDGRERYEQIGPYTVDQVLELIDAGRVKFNDFVWKTGFENWVPLGKLDKFDKPLASSVSVDESLYSKPRYFKEAEVKPAPVKAYAPVQKSPELKEEKPPEGAAGPDLAQPMWAKNIKESMAKPEPARASEPISSKSKPKKEAEAPQTEDVMAPKMASQARSSPIEDDMESKLEDTPAKPQKKIVKEVFNFGNSITNLISPLRGPKKASSAEINPGEKEQAAAPEKKGNPIKYEAVDLGERTRLNRDVDSELVLDRFPLRKPYRSEQKKSVAVESQAASSEVARENTTTAIPPVVVTKVMKKDSVSAPPKVTPQPIPPRDPEEMERVQSRWSKVALGAAVVAMVAGVGLFSMISKRKSGVSAADVAFEDHSPKGTALSQFENAVPVNNSPANSPSANLNVEAAPPPPEPEVVKSNLPAPDMGLPADVKNASKSESKAPAEGEKTAEAPKVVEKEMDVSEMTPKQKSFYHEQERMFIFYNSQKGLNLANLLEQAIQKKNKTPASWKKFQSVWQKQVSTLNGKVAKEIGTSKVHTKLFKSLKTATANLEKRGKDISAQMTSARGPTKDPSVSDIIAEFKKINAKAKSLDQ